MGVACVLAVCLLCRPDHRLTNQVERTMDFRSAVMSFVTDTGLPSAGQWFPFIRTQNFL